MNAHKIYEEYFRDVLNFVSTDIQVLRKVMGLVFSTEEPNVLCGLTSLQYALRDLDSLVKRQASLLYRVHRDPQTSVRKKLSCSLNEQCDFAKNLVSPQQ